MKDVGNVEWQIERMHVAIQGASVESVKQLCDLLSDLSFRKGYLPAISAAGHVSETWRAQVEHHDRLLQELRELRAKIETERAEIESLKPPLLIGKQAFHQRIEARNASLAEKERSARIIVNQIASAQEPYEYAVRQLEELAAAEAAAERDYAEDEATYKAQLRSAIQPLATRACLPPLEITKAASDLENRSYYREFFTAAHDHELFELIGWQHLTWVAYWIVTDSKAWSQMTELVAVGGREIPLKDLIGEFLDQYVRRREDCGHDPKFWWIRTRNAMEKLGSIETTRLLGVMNEWYEEYESSPETLERMVRDGIVGQMRADPEFCRILKTIWESVLIGKSVASSADDGPMLNCITSAERNLESLFHVSMLYRILCETDGTARRG